LFNKNNLALPTCSGATEGQTDPCDSMTAETYCIDSSNKIYKSTGTTGSGTCTAITAPGAHIFSCDDATSPQICGDTIDSTKTLLVYEIAEGGTATAKTDYIYLDTTNSKLVICSSSTCSVSTEGYYLNDSSKSNAPSGTLLIKVDASGNASAATGVAANQYYANAGTDKATKPYIQCTSSTCTAQEIVNEGTFYYLDRGSYDSTESPGKYTKYLLCKKDSSSGSSVSTCTPAAGDATGTILLNSGETKSIITCDASNCSSKSANTGEYYLNSDTNNKFLIECDADRCAKAENPSTVGAYVDSGVLGTNGEKTNIITCDSTDCETKAVATNAGYEIDASDKSKIIESTGSSCESKAHQATDTTPKHYLQAATDKAKVITCTSTTEGCHYEDVSLNGYFVNSGKDSTSKHVIKCVSKSCSEEDDTSAATSCTIGKYIIDNGKVKLCISSETTDAVEIKTGATEQILTLTITADNDFPGTTASSTAHVKIYSDGSVILLEDGALSAITTCNDATVFGLNSDGKKIQTGDTTCTDITAASVNLSSAGSVVLLFDSDGHKVTPPDSGSVKNVVGYQCTFTGSGGNVVLDSCALIKGYAISGSTVVQCSGWKKEGCTIVTLSACADGDEGKMGTGNKVCFNTNGTSLPAASATTPS